MSVLVLWRPPAPVIWRPSALEDVNNLKYLIFTYVVLDSVPLPVRPLWLALRVHEMPYRVFGN